MDNLILILGLAVVVGMIVLNGFIFRKQSRRIKEAEARIKEAEAKAKEIEVLKDTIAQMEKSIDFFYKNFERMKEIMKAKDDAIIELSHDKSEAQKENEMNKKAINQAISCEHVPDDKECPVLVQKRKDEKKHKSTKK